MANIDRQFILTIPNGQQNSNEFEINDEEGWRGPLVLVVLGPNGLTETVTLQIAGPAGNFADYQSNGSDINFTADKATPITIMNAKKVRIRAATAVAAARAFEVLWNVTNR